MRTKLGICLAAVPLLALAQAASAEETMELSLAQMDAVTAGGSAFADAIAQTIGNVAFSDTAAFAGVMVVETFRSEVTTIHNVRSDSIAQSLSATTAPTNNSNGL